jgi:hypothetical protein
VVTAIMGSMAEFFIGFYLVRKEQFFVMIADLATFVRLAIHGI